MSEEKQEGFFSQIKNQIITTVGIVITAGGGLLVTNMEAIFSPAEEVVIQEVIQDSIKNKQPNIIINLPEQQVKEKIIVRTKAPVKKKEVEETLDW
jgi:hypothetical protein